MLCVRVSETAYGTSSLSQPPVVDTNDTIKARFVVGFMGFLGLALVYAMRVNLSVAIVAMVNSTTVVDNSTTPSDACPRPPSPDPTPEPEPVCLFCKIKLATHCSVNHYNDV